MLKIRLQRAGRKNLPQYRIVLAEHSAPVKGKFIEKLGNYDPRAKTINLKKEAILSWLNKGAKPSNTTAKLLLNNGLKHSSVVFEKQTPRKSKKTQEKVEKTAQNEQAETKISEVPAVEQGKDKEETNEGPADAKAMAGDGGQNG